MHNNDINKSDSNNFNDSNVNGSINNLKFGWKKFREIYFLKLQIDLQKQILAE